MHILKNAKLSVKIVGLLLMLGALTLTIAYNGFRALTHADSAYSDLVTNKLPATTKLARLTRRTTEIGYAGYRAMAYDGASREARAAADDAKASYASTQQLLTELRPMLPGSATYLADVARKVDQVHETAERAIAAGLRNDNDAARLILVDVDRQVSALSEQNVAFNNALNKQVDETAAAIAANNSRGSTSMLVISLLGVIAGVAIAIVITRLAITGPLAALQGRMNELAQGNNQVDVPGTDRGDEIGAMAKTVLVFRDAAVALERSNADKARGDAEQRQVVEAVARNLASLAEGDLTADITTDFPPAFAALKTNFNQALAELRTLIGAVMESTASIRTGSGEIAHASENLARRTESNAASLEQTSAALAQIDGRLKATAVAAGTTVQRADQAIATVGGGRAIADEAVQAMGRVSDSARGIDSVIEGVDKIAFQTRVLAMNAAVEAGRAGDAGRGFAVVADLVSALAMRAEEEAKRARDQLTVTQADIVTAVEAVQRVDGALSDISGDVDQVHKLLGTMAADNQAQSSAITEISTAIGTMDQSTQQNAAMVEETSAAARNLNGEVSALSERASNFRVEGGGRAASRRPAATLDQRLAAPTKPLPAAAVPALVRAGGDDWNEF